MQVIFLQEVQFPVINHVLKSLRTAVVKLKPRNSRTFHFQSLFQAATEGYLIDYDTKYNALTKEAQFSFSGESSFEITRPLECCWKQALTSKEHKDKEPRLYYISEKKCKETNNRGIPVFFLLWNFYVSKNG